MEKSISLVDFQSMLGEIELKLDNFDLRYREISNKEYERNIIRSIDYLTSNRKQSGSDYLPIWEAGWGENLALFLKTGNLDTLVPTFVRQKEYIRYDGRWILPVGENFETNIVKIIREHFFHKYFRT